MSADARHRRTTIAGFLLAGAALTALACAALNPVSSAAPTPSGESAPATATPEPPPTLAPLPTAIADTTSASVPGEIAVPDAGNNHVPEGSIITPDHYPPSSGLHYPRTVQWGVYNEEIPLGYWVHNLEHSGIVILYHCPTDCGALETQLSDFANNAPPSKHGFPKVLVLPDPKIEVPIIALAWGWELDLSKFDEAALLEFYKAHVDKGPEDVP